MVRNLFSSPSSKVTLEDVLEHAKKNLKKAQKENDPTKTLQLCNKVDSLMEDAKKLIIALNDNIANVYQEHEKLLNEMGHHDKSQESRNKAEEWRNLSSLTLQIGASRQNESVDTPAVAHPDIPQSLVVQSKNLVFPPAKDIVQIQQIIFSENINPPVIKYTLPEPGGRITSTPQLAYCISLLQPSLISKDGLDNSEDTWVLSRMNDSEEQKRLKTMVTDLIRAFVRDELKKPQVVAEVVSLAVVLEQDDFRKLLQAFVDGIDHSVLLEIHLLDGLAQLIRNAAQGYLEADDLVKILELLNARLKNTHTQSVRYIYRLSLTISQVLDSMVDSQVKGLSREQLHEPLSDYLKGLQSSSNPYLVYQAAYAYQTLQYIPDDETILQSMIRRTGKVVKGISGVVSAVKALDLVGFVEGLQHIQKSLADAGDALGLVYSSFESAKALVQSGQGFMESLKEGLSFPRKSVWYPALRGLDRLLQEGRFAEFEKLVRGAPCQYHPAFQWGVCQRLGEVAANPGWDDNNRKCAFEFLTELYKDDTRWIHQPAVKGLILGNLRQLVDSLKSILGDSDVFFQDLQLSKSLERTDSTTYPMTVILPPQEFPLLDCVQSIPDIETPLRQLKRERLTDRGEDVYISPRAKASQRAKQDFDLTSKVQEFISDNDNKKVFLILGDSGAGKSTFNRALEISLWDKYDSSDLNGRIPLFIHLPTIERPDRDLIGERLRKANFMENQILELKAHREFILICDGYDEIQQTNNLYMSNRLNQPGEWRAQMVISCRTEHTGLDYKDCFQPIDRNNAGTGNSERLEEAIIMPFNKSQIQDYVAQYVSLKKPLWQSEDYLQALKEIPNLQDLVKNPFLLKLALEVLPRLFEKNCKFSEAQITRVQLYDEFVAQWIERSKIRLREMDLSARDKESFRGLADAGFTQLGIRYLKELVTAIYDNQSGNPVVDYLEYRDRKTWKEALFNSEDGKHLLREAIPLSRSGTQYRFVHKSVLEYGLTLAICDPSELSQSIEPATAITSRRGSESSILSFEISDAVERADINFEKYLQDSPLGKRSLVGEPSILHFLTERVQQEPLFKDQLLAIIERSKTNKGARIAAANAMTILVRAGVQFNKVDLRGVKIPGADLSNGVFDSSDLEGADLRNVNFRKVWLRKTNLSRAQMVGTQFGEFPFLEDGDSRPYCCVYSPDGNMFAVGLYDGNISLYETSGYEKTQTFQGHSDSALDVSFSTTDRRLVSGSEDHTLRIWDIDTGECLFTLKGHTNDAASVMYSPNGEQIASGSYDNTVRLWNAKTGECTNILKDHTDWVQSVDYSPSGDQIASASHDNTVRLWDSLTGSCLQILQHQDFLTSVVYSPDGTQIATGNWDKAVRLWDVSTGACIHVFEGHEEDVNSVVFSPKGDRLASGSNDQTVRLWNVHTGEYIRTFEGHTDRVSVIAYSPNGERIASGSEDTIIRLWDVNTGDCVQTFQGDSGKIKRMLYSPKGDRLASTSQDTTVRLWDIHARESSDTLQGHSNRVVCVVYSPDKKQIASASDDFTARLWDVETGKSVHTLQGHNECVVVVKYSPKGDQVASGSSDHTVRLWDVGTGECIHVLRGHSNYVSSIAYSPDGSQIASGGEDKITRLWDVGTGKCVHILRGHTDYIVHVAYSPNGDILASSSQDTTIRLWNAATGSCIHTLEGHSSYVLTMVYSPKGDQIASGSDDKTVRLWDVATGTCIQSLEGHEEDILMVVYSPIGDKVASASWDKTVRIWDIESGECIHILKGHDHQVRSVTFSPRGDRIASGSLDDTAKLWNVETGQCLVTITGFSGSVDSISWGDTFGDHDENQYLVTGSSDKSVRQWSIIKEGDAYKEYLHWSSSHGVLTVSD
ncbi:hypothetical protein BGZ46_006350, partial [Entomortierella lignicola]